MTNKDEKITAMAAWFALRTDPHFISTRPDERYDTRLAVADAMKDRGVIDGGEWRELVEEAALAYADELR